MRLVLVILAICYVIFFACLYATMSELPARIASHFDALGRPNGWMERGAISSLSSEWSSGYRSSWSASPQ
jgi:uncharacterized membrane protein